MECIKRPLGVYILYDADSEKARKVYEYIYKKLCRDPYKPLENHIGIPVYSCTNPDGYKIDTSGFDKTAVIILVDMNMYGSDKWEACVSKITNNYDDKICILPVSLYRYSNEFCPLKKYNFIKYADDDIWENEDDFDIRLYDFLITNLTDKYSVSDERLRVFISHAKHDGKASADAVKSYIAMNTKLSYFYDANSIKDGKDFAAVITQNASKSLLLVINTDAYSSRDWCQQEIIIAKENAVPILIVDFVNDKIDRVFPYLGNVPLIRGRDDNMSDILKFLLMTALKHCYQERYLNYVVSRYNFSNVHIMPCKPELFSLVSKVLPSKMKIVLYPEPPIGKFENDFLEKCFPCVKIATPINMPLVIDHKSFCKKKIAVSVSDGDGKNILMIKDFMTEFARYVVCNGGHLIYGGDLRSDGYTRIFSEVAKNYGGNSCDGEYYFTNYFAWPIYLELNNEAIAEFKHAKTKIEKIFPGSDVDEKEFIKPDTIENKMIRAKSLTKMREKKNEATDVLVIMGGKTEGFSGVLPGVLEEFLLAVRKRKPVYVLGGLGGMAGIIKDVITGNIGWKEFREIFDKCYSCSDFLTYYYGEHKKYQNTIETIFGEIKNSKDLVNHNLSNADRNELFSGLDIYQIITTLMNGISKL